MTLAVAAAAAAVTWLFPYNLAGVAQVVDGDSLVVAGERVRLAGIDAPEFGQSCNRAEATVDCGRIARQRLRELIGDAPVLCRGQGFDRYGRTLARCEANGRDINALMVRGGWAVSDGGYPREQHEARQARLGLWALDFENPRDWRRDHRREAGLEVDTTGRLIGYVRHAVTVAESWFKQWFSKG